METPQPREDTDPWLVWTLKDHSVKLESLNKEVRAINGSLREEISQRKLIDSVHDERIARQKERLEEHRKTEHKNNPDSNSSDSVTFRWILEKLALPVIMLVAGGVLALLFGA